MTRRKYSTKRRVKQTRRRSPLEIKIHKAQRVGIKFLAGVGAVALTLAIFGLLKYFGG